MAVEKKRMLILRGTTSDWQLNNIVLLPGELAIQDFAGTDPIIRCGDGVRPFLSLPAIGSGLTVGDFASQPEVDAGVVADKPISPATLDGNLVGQRFSAGLVSSGAADQGKAPRLNSTGRLDTSFVSISIATYQGTFDPSTDGGQGSVPAPIQNGVPGPYTTSDFAIASTAGTYNFATGQTGSGTPVAQGGFIFFNAGDNWDYVPSSSASDALYLRLDGSNTVENDITFELSPGGDPQFGLSNALIEGGTF